MAAKKIKDIAVKTGEYTDRNGNTKGRWQNVGALMKSDDGSVFIMLQRWFNPAGINSDRESILLSCFDLQDRNENGGGNGGGSRQQSRQRQADIDDEIPF